MFPYSGRGCENIVPKNRNNEWLHLLRTQQRSSCSQHTRAYTNTKTFVNAQECHDKHRERFLRMPESPFSSGVFPFFFFLSYDGYVAHSLKRKTTRTVKKNESAELTRYTTTYDAVEGQRVPHQHDTMMEKCSAGIRNWRARTTDSS